MQHTDLCEIWRYMWQYMLGFNGWTAISQCLCPTCEVQCYKITLEWLEATKIECNISWVFHGYFLELPFTNRKHSVPLQLKTYATHTNLLTTGLLLPHWNLVLCNRGSHLILFIKLITSGQNQIHKKPPSCSSVMTPSLRVSKQIQLKLFELEIVFIFSWQLKAQLMAEIRARSQCTLFPCSNAESAFSKPVCFSTSLICC